MYTWGSGYHGQLGLGPTTITLTPTLVDDLADNFVLAKKIVVGSHHTAIITLEGEMYSWGSNKNRCLGRNLIGIKDVEYSSEPGHVGGFGAIVDQIGRGLVRDIGIGKEFMVVATYPYEGPSLEVSRRIMEERKVMIEERRLKRRQLALQKEDDTMIVGGKKGKRTVQWVCSMGG